VAHDGEQVATGRSVLLIEREIEVLDFVDFSLPPARLDFHPSESIERAHGCLMQLFGSGENVGFIFWLIVLL
jgi:hypothetical protein